MHARGNAGNLDMFDNGKFFWFGTGLSTATINYLTFVPTASGGGPFKSALMEFLYPTSHVRGAAAMHCSATWAQPRRHSAHTSVARRRRGGEVLVLASRHPRTAAHGACHHAPPV